MKIYKIWILLFASIILKRAHGQTKAISEISLKGEFKLLANALKNIGVVTKPVTTTGLHTLSREALVHSLDQVMVYRLRDGWFKLVPINLIRTEGTQILFRSSEIQVGDHVVIGGAALLRVVDMEAFGGGE